MRQPTTYTSNGRARRVPLTEAPRRYAVTFPSERPTNSEAYIIVDRETNGMIATVYLDGDGGLTRRYLRAKKQADLMCLALNKFELAAQREATDAVL